MGKDQDLLDAARTGNVVTIHKILSARPRNPLSHAIAIGFRRSVAPNCQDSSGYTPLHHAVLNGHKPAVDILLKYDASPGTPDAKGSTPFHLAAWTGETEIIRVLMSHTRSYSQVNEQNNDWDTPLHFAAQYGHIDVVKILLENGADPTICNKKEETPLDLAALYGRLDTVELLLRRRPEILARQSERRSILHMAARNGHPQVIKALLDAGCDINKTLKSGSALHEAALFGKVEAIRVLLEHDPPVDYRIQDLLGETALQKVEGYPSRVAVEIAAMINAHIRGEPLPPSSSTPSLLRKTETAIDAEQRSTYDNVPPTTGPATPPIAKSPMRHSAYTPPLGKTRGQVRPHRPTTGQLGGRATNYINVDLPNKVPPKKPARSSVGIMLDRDSAHPPRSESPLVNSIPEKIEVPTPNTNSSHSQPPPQSPEKSPPPLPDRNYYDEDVAGEYTQLRPSATKTAPSNPIPAPSRTPVSSFKSHNPPAFPSQGSGIQVRSNSAKNRHVYETERTDAAPVLSSKEDVNELRKSLNLLDPAPFPAPAPGHAPLPSSSPESESFYEDLSEAYSGELVSQQQSEESSAQSSAQISTDPHPRTMRSSTSSEQDIDVYELLSDATSGRHGNYDDYDVPPPTAAQSAVDCTLQELSPTKVDDPVPPPRRQKYPGSKPPHLTPTIPIPPAHNLNGLPQPCQSTSSFFSDGQSSGTEDSDIPSSPGSCYSQPPTPDHPPPSPHTAMMGIQAKLSPQSFPHSLRGIESTAQPWLVTERQSAFQSVRTADDLAPIAGQYHLDDAPYDISQTNFSLADTVPAHNPSADQRLKSGGISGPSQAQLVHREQSDTSQSEFGSYSDRQLPCSAGEGRGCARPVDGSLRRSDSDGYRANDEYQSVTDTSSSGDSEFFRLDGEDPFAGLIYGSNRGSRNLSLETSSRFSLSHLMADWSLASSSRTSMAGENGQLDGLADRGGGGAGQGGGAEENAGIDENSEWAQIESIMASFGAGLVRESVYIRDFQKEFEKMFEGPGKPQSVGEWLDNLGMGQYENMMIANGFDNLDFMGGKILEESDLVEIGIMEELHRKIILQSTSALPVMKTINDTGSMPLSVSEWLRSLLLSDCIPTFTANGITSMERARELWEVELENVLEVHMLGHRKRILASLGERRHSVCSSSSNSLPRPNSLELTTDDLELKLSSFERRKQLSSTASEQSASLDIDLFKDYSKEVTTPTKSVTTSAKSVTTPANAVAATPTNAVAATPANTNPTPAQSNLLPSHDHSNGDATPPQLPGGATNGQPHPATDATPAQHSDGEDYDNMPGAGQASAEGNHRASAEGVNPEDLENGPTSPAVQWRHPSEALVKGCCNYTASYLGSTLVREVKGIDSTQESCTKLRRSASHLQKIPSITLSISYIGVKFIDFKSKMIITEHEICNISFVTQDEDDLRTFAYITKDSENEKLYCHVFSVKAEDIATEIILTLGQAFEIAYQMLLKTRPASNEHTRALSNTSENEHVTKL